MKINFWINLLYKGDESSYCLNKSQICKFKALDNIRWYSFSLENVSEDFAKDDRKKIALNSHVYDFPFDKKFIKIVIIINNNYDYLTHLFPMHPFSILQG